MTRGLAWWPRVVGTVVGIVAAAVLLGWILGLSFTLREWRDDRLSSTDTAALSAALDEWRPGTGTGPPMDLRVSRDLDEEADDCRDVELRRWRGSGERALLLTLTCTSSETAFRHTDAYRGDLADLGTPAGSGNLARTHAGPETQVVWRERNLVQILRVRCAPADDCAAHAQALAREATTLGPGAPRVDPRPPGPTLFLTTPFAIWLLLVGPFRLVALVRRQSWPSVEATRYHDVTRHVRRSLRGVQARRWGRWVVGLGLVYTGVGLVGLVLDPTWLAFVATGAGGLVTTGAIVVVRRFGRSAPRSVARTGTGARAAIGTISVAFSGLLSGWVVMLYGLIAVFGVVASVSSLDVMYRALIDAQSLSSPLEVVRWVILSIAIGNREDIGFTILYALLPALAVAFVARRFGLALRAADARTLRAADVRPPILYLRSFDEDRLRIPAPHLRRGILERLVPWRRRSFEQVLAAALSSHGPVYAVSDPRTRLPRLGAAKEELPHDRWHHAVEQMAARSLVVVMSGTPATVRDGLLAELTMLSRHRDVRLLVVRAPYRRRALARRWSAFLAAAVPLPLFAPLAASWVQEGTHVVAYDPTRGWEAWGSRRRTARSYDVAIDAAFDRYGETWAAGCAWSWERTPPGSVPPP